ncbi:MAG: phage baseplate assembly protein V [Roseobacter sp.]
MDPLSVQVARQQQRTYYGKYRGFVVDNQDPDQLGRVKVRVPSVLGEAVSGWALPCAPFGGLNGQGLFAIPEVGAQLWIEFEEGNPNTPIWVGTFWRTSDAPPQDARKSPPETRILQTPSGHKLQFDDQSGEEQITLAHQSGADLVMDVEGNLILTNEEGSTLTLDAASGSVTLEDARGNSLTMESSGTTVEDANGNKIKMGPAGIEVDGTTVTIKGAQVAVGSAGGEPLIKGASFLALFATHMHTTTLPGLPTTPPIPQGEMSTLTTKTTAS